MSTTRKRSWNWHFGVNAWLDFSTGVPVNKTKPAGFDNFAPREGCDSVSDPDTGVLLFYTDGIAIWGADHQIKQVSVSSSGLDPDYSIQAITIVRQPGSTATYYLFMVGDWTPSPTTVRQIEYRTYNPFTNTLGTLTTLSSPSDGAGYAENLTAILHANKEDYWIVTKMKNNNELKAWLLSSTGITGPTISTASFSYTGSNRFGQIKVAPYGNRVALCMGTGAEGNGSDPTLVVWAFNNSTGVFSDENIIMTQANGYWRVIGVDWSPNSENIYVSNFWSVGGFSTIYKIHLYGQCYEIAETSVAAPNLGAVQRGPDNEVYIANPSSTTLYKISDPDSDNISVFTSTFTLDEPCQKGLPVVPSIKDEKKDYRVFYGGQWHSVCDGDVIRVWDDDTNDWKELQIGDKYWNETLQIWETIACSVPVPADYPCWDVIGFFAPESEGYDPPFNSSGFTGLKVNIAAVIGSNLRILSDIYPSSTYTVVLNEINGPYRDIVVQYSYAGSNTTSKIIAL